MQWNHPQSAHVPLLRAPTVKYLLPVSRCWLSSFICHPKIMHSSGVCSWLLHASLTTNTGVRRHTSTSSKASPDTDTNHCQYDHRRPNPQRLSSICGVWINHRYSSRKMIDVDVHRCRQKIAIKWNDFFGKYKATAVKVSTLVDVCGGWWMISSPPFAFGYYYQYGDHIGASLM